MAEGEIINEKKDRFHFAIGGDNRIMPFEHGNLFNVVPLIQVKKDKRTRIVFTIDFNKILKNGDDTNYSLNDGKATLVHGGYFADVLSRNVKYAIDFKSIE